MAKEKRSFFERLTGSVSLDDYQDDIFEDEMMLRHPRGERGHHPPASHVDESKGIQDDWVEEEASEGQLSVDVFQTSEEIIIRAHVAGVKPDDLDVSITRDMVTIRGKREEHQTVENEDFFFKELYWGAFSRTILLPQEVEVEDAVAQEKHGLLTIRLPKIDKEKQTKLKVKSN